MNVNKEKEARLTQEWLKGLLHYDKDSGKFTWLSGGSGVKASRVAGHVEKGTGYRRVKIGGVRYQAHRLAFLYIAGEWPKDQVDHINGSRDDNSWGNLREVNNKENCRNKGLGGNNTSGFVGVSWSKASGKWCAHIGINGKTVRLGNYYDLENAIQARRVADIKYGYHQNHGRQVEEI